MSRGMHLHNAEIPGQRCADSRKRSRLFFGYGHIDPRMIMANGFTIRVGDFQLSSKTNPATGGAANTYFYGTFFGKLSDWDGDGRLDVNTRPVHCDAAGNLDYLGMGRCRQTPYGLTTGP